MNVVLKTAWLISNEAIELQYKIENVWKEKPESLKDEIKAFWQHWKALPANVDVNQRVDQVLLAVRNEAGEIVGIGSTYLMLAPGLGQLFYHYRTFVAPEMRRTYVAKEMLLAAQKYIENYNSSHLEDGALGMMLEVENDALKYGGITVKRAVWQETGFVYIGMNSVGAHRRVYYFPGALIEERPKDSPVGSS